MLKRTRSSAIHRADALCGAVGNHHHAARYALVLEQGGNFYGRGTADDKAMAAFFAANLIRFQQVRSVPDRDIIVGLTAVEEGSPCGCNGVRSLLQNQRDLVDADVVASTAASSPTPSR